MTLAQVEQLLKTDLTPWWRAYFHTGIMCGLRPGELLGLRWQDVDIDAGVIRVRKSVKVHEGDGPARPVIEDLKTERSKRTLEMPAAVASMLAALGSGIRSCRSCRTLATAARVMDATFRSAGGAP
jgi:integrase